MGAEIRGVGFDVPLRSSPTSSIVRSLPDGPPSAGLIPPSHPHMSIEEMTF